MISERVRREFIRWQIRLYGHSYLTDNSSDDNDTELCEDTQVDTGNRDDGEE